MIQAKKIKNLNLFTIKFPLPALVSILHRMSGVFLFLLMPILTISLWYSLISEQYFLQVVSFFKLWPIKFISLILIWGITHHILAGTRHLFLDLQLGLDLITARFSSKTVLLVSFLITFLISLSVW
ncbi:MAG: succinate dehydrogenase, cytochrome b556 subunit [Nitrosomonadales bacterium]|nr:succinate dehydrogenase, cytochrome b556 subunit [Nitrosomonadales bacterium]|tara:strand:- start:1031 stop:1408 length:378 start_codon:yes stop_codon:yes gene_type:complete